ncbi:hypothetical protein SY27_11300 [Flavobacterium sp. 316]|uniref:hypothetical protein n=1 Tax=Flavobacterium sp. 316 TaxID=1603293 RepID=UPI0005DC355A|nr:hypothetical protein [Flavobacterium sp. 316]KIX20496.1 hypothetical protein SY27_11300 [Flavobacterium sp. 316]
MKFKIFTIIVITLLMLSCKKELKTQNNDQTIEIKDDFFRATFELTVLEDDNMHLYYSVDGTTNFDEKNSLWVPVKGSSDVQPVTFVFPEGVIPSLFRVDFGFGKNEKQSDVSIKDLKMSFMGLEEKIEGVAIMEYFTPNTDVTEVVPGTSILKRVKKDQEIGPILYPKAILSEKINKLTFGNSPE